MEAISSLRLFNFVSDYYFFDAVLQAFQAGIVWINCSQPCFTQAPWGGNKRSGFGRELGEWYGLDSSSQKCKILFNKMFLTQEPDRKNGEIARNYVNRKRESMDTTFNTTLMLLIVSDGFM